MFSEISRRHFLSGAAAFGLAAQSFPAFSQTPSKLLGHAAIGNGPEAVAVLHQWLGDHTNFDWASPLFSRDKATYVLTDLRGYGLSRHLTGQYTIEEAAADVLALMDKRGFSRFHVVGHSMSGMIAQYLALHFPDRVKSVVCISPVPASGYKGDPAPLRAVITDDAAFATAVHKRTSARYGQPFVDWMRSVARTASPEALEGYLTMFTTTDFAAQAVNLPIPAVLITGARDIKFYSQGDLEPQFRKAFTNLQVAAIADAGHYPMMETPILLAALVERAIFGQPVTKNARVGRPGAGELAQTSDVQGGIV